VCTASVAFEYPADWQCATGDITISELERYKAYRLVRRRLRRRAVSGESGRSLTVAQSLQKVLHLRRYWLARLERVPKAALVHRGSSVAGAYGELVFYSLHMFTIRQRTAAFRTELILLQLLSPLATANPRGHSTTPIGAGWNIVSEHQRRVRRKRANGAAEGNKRCK
jgi:hypothetical protein